MEGGKDESSADKGISRPQGKISYSQAAATHPQTFFRKIDYRLGVVELIHRTNNNAYARISVGRGEELSIRINPPTDLKPGDLLEITESKADGSSHHSIFGTHTGRVADKDHPLCKGKVKWFDRKQSTWTIKVRSSRRYLRFRPERLELKQDQTIFFIPKFHNGSMEIKKIMALQGGIPEGTPPTWTISQPLATRLHEELAQFHLVEPTTRSDLPRTPQLDTQRAEAALPRDHGPLHLCPYLQLEELFVRQDFPSTTEWKDDQKYHQALRQGLSPLLFISDDKPDKILRILYQSLKNLRKIT